MPTADPMQILEQAITAAIGRAFAGRVEGEPDPALAPSRNPEFGDFQSNAAMPLAKKLGMKPRDVAAAIVGAIDVSSIAEAPEIAGPGFINFRLKGAALDAALAAMDDGRLGIEPVTLPAGQNIVVDLCGVNLAKEMHVGHLRATAIGDALARLHERLGYTVVRQNHLGDWGLPIAMVTYAVAAKVDAGELRLESLTVEDLEREYRDAQARSSRGQAEWGVLRKFGMGPKVEAEWEEEYRASESFRVQVRAALVALQEGDARMRRVWERIARVTLDACFEVCRRLAVNVTDEATAGESSFRDELAGVVADLVSRGVAEESDGALVVRLEEFGIREPCLIRKRDGGYLYATTDIAAIRRRVQKLGGVKVIYAVDARQGLHFRQVFAAATKAGYARHACGRDAELIHAAFGTILGSDGTPFKTRSGDNVKLKDLLDEAAARAERAVAEKNPDLPADERRAVAEAVGVGAIKYADLSSDRVKDYVFDFDRMLAFEGNTGPYLMYALVRVHSILRKAAERGVDVSGLVVERDTAGSGAPGFAVAAAEEKAVALELLKYPGVVRSAAEACEPHRLCGYLYGLAGSFSTFFEACPVLRAPDEATMGARLRLCRLTGRVLRDGLMVLGLRPLERM